MEAKFHRSIIDSSEGRFTNELTPTDSSFGQIDRHEWVAFCRLRHHLAEYDRQRTRHHPIMFPWKPRRVSRITHCAKCVADASWEEQNALARWEDVRGHRHLLHRLFTYSCSGLVGCGGPAIDFDWLPQWQRPICDYHGGFWKMAWELSSLLQAIVGCVLECDCSLGLVSVHANSTSFRLHLITEWHHPFDSIESRSLCWD